jgi:hypothetical protein
MRYLVFEFGERGYTNEFSWGKISECIGLGFTFGFWVGHVSMFWLRKVN